MQRLYNEIMFRMGDSWAELARVGVRELLNQPPLANTRKPRDNDDGSEALERDYGVCVASPISFSLAQVVPGDNLIKAC